MTPIHAGASAKALLAFLEQPIVEEILGRKLEALAPGTVTDPEVMREQLDADPGPRLGRLLRGEQHRGLGAGGADHRRRAGGRVDRLRGAHRAALRLGGPHAGRLVCEAARDSEARLEAAA